LRIHYDNGAVMIRERRRCCILECGIDFCFVTVGTVVGPIDGDRLAV